MPPSASPAPRAALLLGAFLVFGLAACNGTNWPDHDPAVIENAGADSLLFWPPRAYALPGDVLSAEVRGLKRVYACSRVLLLEWTPLDSAGGTFFRLRSRVELPPTAECALAGLDTVLEGAAPAAGRTLFLQTPQGRVMDSLRVIAGTGVIEGFLHVRAPGDTLRTFGRYLFRDSTAGHPRRTLMTDSLQTCEVIQAAVSSRLRGGDTLSIRFRTLLADPPLPAAQFPVCAGPHADTAEVVADRYGFP